MHSMFWKQSIHVHNIQCYTIRVIWGFSITELAITYYITNLLLYKRIIVRLLRLLDLLAYTYFSIILVNYEIIFYLVLVKYIKIRKKMPFFLLSDKYKYSYRRPVQPSLTSFSWDLNISSLRFLIFEKHYDNDLHDRIEVSYYRLLSFNFIRVYLVNFLDFWDRE